MTKVSLSHDFQVSWWYENI